MLSFHSPLRSCGLLPSAARVAIITLQGYPTPWSFGTNHISSHQNWQTPGNCFSISFDSERSPHSLITLGAEVVEYNHLRQYAVTLSGTPRLLSTVHSKTRHVVEDHGRMRVRACEINAGSTILSWVPTNGDLSTRIRGPRKAALFNPPGTLQPSSHTTEKCSLLPIACMYHVLQNRSSTHVNARSPSPPLRYGATWILDHLTGPLTDYYHSALLGENVPFLPSASRT